MRTGAQFLAVTQVAFCLVKSRMFFFFSLLSSLRQGIGKPSLEALLNAKGSRFKTKTVHKSNQDHFNDSIKDTICILKSYLIFLCGLLL